MTLLRPPQQLSLDFHSEAESACVREPQGGQSSAAVTEQPTLDSRSEDLLESIVDADNMQRAWKHPGKRSAQ